jgi:hypothetical protein
MARQLTFLFASTHVPVSALGAAAPGAVGPVWLGRRVRHPVAREALRAFCAADALAAAAVADAVLRGRPVAGRLTVGIGGDLARAALSVAALRRGPRPVALAVAAASLTGAALATGLRRRVDA